MEKRLIRFQKGFALIELMVVVCLVAILSALAIPNYLNYQCQAKQIEVKRNLGQLFTMEVAYRSENGKYSNNLALIGWSITGQGRYSYSITMATSTLFTARASANLDNDLIVDTWVMDNFKNLVNSTNDCS
ncbi:MAG: prepilin-type N-terminal cleavage/methylation domain-containing protein [Thermodesulfobacteriota bacterium]|nr:prepilin-type N-terminal cleavage/methylation domain-containing protein [Thermodesulfobacteriota bacterium]